MAIKKSNASVLKKYLRSCWSICLKPDEWRMDVTVSPSSKRGSFMACSFPSTPPIQNCNWFNFSKSWMPSSAWPTQVVWQNSLQCWIVYQYRSWQKKPCINSVAKHLPLKSRRSETLKNLLEFCFHDLSPRKIERRWSGVWQNPVQKNGKICVQLHATRNWDARARSLRCRVAPSADLLMEQLFWMLSMSDRCGSATEILWGKQASNWGTCRNPTYLSSTILLRFCQRNYICRFERWSGQSSSDGMSVTDLEVRLLMKHRLKAQKSPLHQK